MIGAVALLLSLGQAQTETLRATNVWPVPFENVSHRDIRKQFVDKFRKFSGGMTKEEVRKFLGEPDGFAKRRGQFILGQGRYQAVEAWMYGSQGPGTLPTLGFVCFNEAGIACEPWCRRTVDPPDPSVVSEQELRATMRLFYRSSRLDYMPTTHDPLQVIRIVNTLQGLGQVKALAVLREYTQIGAPIERGNNPELYYGAIIAFGASEFFHPRKQKDGKWENVSSRNMPSPWYPYILVDDVPFFAPAIRPFFEDILGGSDLDIWSELKAFARSSRFIKRPLRPPDDPSRQLDRLRLMAPWAYHEPKNERVIGHPVFNAPGQLAKLVRPALVLEQQDERHDLNGRIFEPKIVKALKETRLRWDVTRGEYMRWDH